MITQKEFHLILIAVAILLTVVEATYEGLRHRGQKTKSKLIELFYRLAVYGAFAYWGASKCPFTIQGMNVLAIFIGFILMRVALFRPLWNIIGLKDFQPTVYVERTGQFIKLPKLTLKKKYLYLGTTSVYDKFLYWICHKSPFKPPESIFLPTLEIMSLLLSIAFLTGNVF